MIIVEHIDKVYLVNIYNLFEFVFNWFAVMNTVEK